ncbi:hypothetical protein PoB_001913800 [Plakobranchus ocellatus]|uniref:Uncharacterized protein n=1 Tax=Plakobranchus ocellatus TaxID=259542 RepID=A0AAV3ZDV2_9GAST|nr:hypothetical protein PoB_001913800 [Plakobranchus ocellatus]
MVAPANLTQEEKYFLNSAQIDVDDEENTEEETENDGDELTAPFVSIVSMQAQAFSPTSDQGAGSRARIHDRGDNGNSWADSHNITRRCCCFQRRLASMGRVGMPNQIGWGLTSLQRPE